MGIGILICITDTIYIRGHMDVALYPWHIYDCGVTNMISTALWSTYGHSKYHMVRWVNALAY